MLTLRTKVRETEDGTLEVSVPATALPPGEPEAAMAIVVGARRAGPPAARFRVADLPVHDAPWDGSVSLRREDLYGDDGR